MENTEKTSASFYFDLHGIVRHSILPKTSLSLVLDPRCACKIISVWLFLFSCSPNSFCQIHELGAKTFFPLGDKRIIGCFRVQPCTPYECRLYQYTGIRRDVQQIHRKGDCTLQAEWVVYISFKWRICCSPNLFLYFAYIT